MIEFKPNETFTSAAILTAAISALDAGVAEEHAVYVTNTPGFGMCSALDEKPLSFSAGTDDLIVSVQMRIPHHLRDNDAVEELVGLATLELIGRSEEERLAAIQARRAQIVALEDEITALNQ